MRRPLPRKLILEARTGAPDGLGGRTTAWALKGTHWGRLFPQTARMEAGEGGARSRARYRITIRAVPYGAPSRPEPGDRFREGVRAFHIRGVVDADEAGQILACYVDEEVQP